MSKLVDLDEFLRMGSEAPSKVLIVDDHPVIRLAVRLLLNREGYEVIAETDNGVDAIALAREHVPDLIILDIGIPKLGGLDVIARLSSLELPLRILVLTGQNPSHYAARCMHANVTDGILQVRPRGLSLAVDVSSGVEATGPDGKPLKGIKDAGKIQRFVAAVRAADAQLASFTDV